MAEQGQIDAACCKALSSLAADSAHISSEIARAGGIVLILDAMFRLPSLRR